MSALRRGVLAPLDGMCYARMLPGSADLTATLSQRGVAELTDPILRS